MSKALVFDEEKTEAALNRLTRCLDQDYLEIIGQLGALLREEMATDPMAANMFEKCKTLEVSYNDLVENNYLPYRKVTEDSIELGQNVLKADLGEIKKASYEASSSRVDVGHFH